MLRQVETAFIDESLLGLCAFVLHQLEEVTLGGNIVAVKMLHAGHLKHAVRPRSGAGACRVLDEQFLASSAAKLSEHEPGLLQKLRKIEDVLTRMWDTRERSGTRERFAHLRGFFFQVH